jgi:hypothetical protein
VQDVFHTSGLKPSAFLNAMDTQEPGILQELTEEIQQFLKEQLEEEKRNTIKPIPPKLLLKWKKELSKAYRKDNKRTNDLGKWYREGRGDNVGRPGNAGTGRPGELNRGMKQS